MKKSQQQQLYSVWQTAAMLGLSVPALYSRIKRGQVPERFIVQVGKNSLLIKAGYLKFAGAQKQKPGIKSGYKYKPRVPESSGVSESLD